MHMHVYLFPEARNKEGEEVSIVHSFCQLLLLTLLRFD
jgi:hypothetical protein